jgi:hypothetical protein
VSGASSGSPRVASRQCPIAGRPVHPRARYEGPRAVPACLRPSTLGRPGPPAHCPGRSRRRTLHLRRDAANRGSSGRRPRTLERTPERAKGPAMEISFGVTSRATMSDRPRPGTRPAGLIARSSRNKRSPPKVGGDRRVRARATKRPSSSPGSAGLVDAPSARNLVRYDLRRAGRAIGKAPHPAGGVSRAAAPRVYFGRSRVAVEAARTGEVMRSRDQGASSVP